MVVGESETVGNELLECDGLVVVAFLLGLINFRNFHLRAHLIQDKQFRYQTTNFATDTNYSLASQDHSLGRLQESETSGTGGHPHGRP